MKYLKKYENFKSTKATLDEVFSECNVFIEDLKKCVKGSFLIRGVNNNDIDIEMFERDYNRSPRDLNYDLHEKFNFFFEKKFGWEVRSGVFCYGGRKHQATGLKLDAGYGTKTYLLFPKDEYSIVWNRSIGDLYSEFEDSSPDTYYEQERYDEIYGEGCEEGGNWTLDDENTGEYDKQKAAEWCAKHKKLFGYEEWYDMAGNDAAEELRNKYNSDFETEEEYNDYIKSTIIDDLIWEPKTTFEEYYSDIEENYFNNELHEIVEKTVEDYKQVDHVDDDVFQNTAHPSTELSLKCDEYYLIDQTHLEEIIQRIWG